MGHHSPAKYRATDLPLKASAIGTSLLLESKNVSGAAAAPLIVLKALVATAPTAPTVLRRGRFGERKQDLAPPVDEGWSKYPSAHRDSPLRSSQAHHQLNPKT
mmetsp:Transcript_1488/g.2610  ORF Transcript_1488/g.2610 Transcript_1488/m.2610 type:complete len:103 (-) Transcript_1488:7-315(-)